MVEGFRISSDMLLERLKDLESVHFQGERPQTAQVLGRIEQERMNRPKIMDDIQPPQVLNLENGDPDEFQESEKENRCTHCNQNVPIREFAKHTVECIRNSVKWKVWGETFHKDNKKQHLQYWRNPKRMAKAIEEDDDETLLMMFNHGAKAKNPINRKKELHPLHYVAKHGSVRWLLILLGSGLEEISPPDSSGDTPLNIAIRENKTVVAKSLVELGAELESKDPSMRTPLMNACLYGNFELVELLLKWGADLKATNELKDTWMTLAQRSKNTDIVMLLADKGAALRPMSGMGNGRPNALSKLKIKKKPNN